MEKPRLLDRVRHTIGALHYSRNEIRSLFDKLEQP